MSQTTETVDVGWEAGRDFARARRGAFFRRLVRGVTASFRGGAAAGAAMDRLACFGEARDGLGEVSRVRLGLETVEVGKISGSVGRCLDFDRGFLPVCACTRGRWESVDRAFHQRRWLPPIELYKLGEAYFVLDGNHRVSVARYRRVAAVDAVVTEFLAPCGCPFS